MYSCNGHVDHKFYFTWQRKLYPDNSDFRLAVKTTCKLLNQLEGLRQLDSRENDVLALIVVTETNMKDSCQWVSKLAYFVCAYNNYLTC